MTPDNRRSYEPIEPNESANPIGARLISELRVAPVSVRIILPVYLIVSSGGGLYGGYALTDAYSNWITWAISLLILEPIGMASLLALVVIVFPHSTFSTLLAHALERAKLAAILLGLAFAGFIASALIYIAAELWRLR